MPLVKIRVVVEEALKDRVCSIDVAAGRREDFLRRLGVLGAGEGVSVAVLLLPEFRKPIGQGANQRCVALAARRGPLFSLLSSLLFSSLVTIV